MCSPDPPRLDELVALVSRVLVTTPRPVILIDGPSGAGKSTLASALVAAWPGDDRPELVRMDDIYPGWDGLQAAAEQVTEHLLRPRRAGRPGRWRRHDWMRDLAGEWTEVTGAHPLVVEGCGTLARENVALSDIRVWIGADDERRKARALARDGDTFAVNWDRWQLQWERWCRIEEPQRWATFRLSLDGPD